MKKFLLMAIVMMASTSVFAQREAGTLTLQPRVGLIAADFNNTGDTEARVGLVTGAEFEYYLSSAVGLSVGALYAQQGAEMKDYDITFKLDYLNVPVILNFYLWKGLAIKAGLQPGFKLSSEVEGSFRGARGTVNIEDYVNKVDLAIPVGISYDFGRLVLDARYTFGTKHIFKDAADLDSKNLTFQIGLGYKFSL